LIRGLVAVTISGGILTAGHLTSSYHLDTVTGNPNYTSGRFWHTPLSGQYPRDRGKMKQYQQAQVAKMILKRKQSTNNGIHLTPEPRR
jgi:hypothetical protein